MRWLPAVALLVLLSGCFPLDDNTTGNAFPSEAVGLRPIYADPGQAHQVSGQPARALENAGKIFVYGNYLFVNERYKGVHIINNADPRNPVNVAFINIPGNIDIAVKGTVLYADNYDDLVALDIRNPLNVSVLSRVEDAIPSSVRDFPLETGVYFECVDPSKGVVVGWEEATLQNPECFR